MKLKEKGFILCCFILAIALLSGCGADSASDPSQENDSQDDGGAKGAAEEPITLHFWGGVPAENGPQAAVDEWNRKHPDIQVQYTRYVNDDKGNLKVNTALQTQQQIDILVSHSPNHLEQRADSGFVYDIQEYAGIQVEEMVGNAAKRWEMDGTYYGLPTNINAQFLLINKKALDDAGLPVPKDWTWQELQRYAETLSENYEFGYARDANTVHAIIGNALIDDGYVKEDGTSNLDHPNVKEGLKLFKEMMDNGAIPKYSEQVATNMAVDHLFLQGKVAMYQAGAWKLRMTNNLEEYPRDFDIAFAPIPHFEGQSNQAHLTGDTLSIVKNTQHPEEAWAFIQWYAKEGMLHLSPGGRVPALKDAPIDEALTQITKGAEETYDLDSIKNVYSIENTKVKVEPPFQVLDQIKSEIEKYFIGEQSLDATVQNMVDFHNQHLQQN